MKVAIIGTGNIANTHALALRRLEQEICLVVGTSKEKAEAFASKWSIPRYSEDMDAVLSSDAECVHICTPPAMHYEMVKAVLNAGKSVVCEKPFCLKSDETFELYELAKKKNLKGAVNFNVRYHEGCQKAHNMIADKAFGDVHLVHGSYLQEFHVLPAEYMWRYIPSKGGAYRAVTEIGSHLIDLVRFWTGLEITAVSASFGAFNKKRFLKDGMMYEERCEGSEEIIINSEDAASITVRFSNGALGNFLLSEVSHGKSNEVKLEVSSGQNSVWWNSEDPYRLNSASGKFNGVKSDVCAFYGGFPDTFESFFKDIYSSDSNNYPSFYDGYKNAAVCEAICQSAENNSVWVEVK